MSLIHQMHTKNETPLKGLETLKILVFINVRLVKVKGQSANLLWASNVLIIITCLLTYLPLTHYLVTS